MALTIEAARRAGIELGVLNQRDSAQARIVVRLHAGTASGCLDLREGQVPLESVQGVFVRLMDPMRLPEAQRDPSAAERIRLFHAILQDWIELTPGRVLNRLGPAAGNASKPAQARELVRLGWRVPETLVTSDADAVTQFRARHQRIVFKSASGVRSIVTEFTDADVTRLWRLRALPAQFQELVPGTDLRVHVVGDKLFATEAVSDALDYRYAARSGAPARLAATTLPADVAARCIATAAALQLPLCGIDLRRRPDGEHVAFEVNPAPAFSWYQESTGQPIADAIVAYLAGRE